LPTPGGLSSNTFLFDNLVFVLIGKASEIQASVAKYAPVMDKKTITQPGF
jgi:hypothetical protein